MLYVKWLLGVSLFFSATASADMILTPKRQKRSYKHAFMHKYDRQIAAMDHLSAQISRKILIRDKGLTNEQDKSGMKVALVPVKR